VRPRRPISARQHCPSPIAAAAARDAQAPHGRAAPHPCATAAGTPSGRLPLDAVVEFARVPGTYGAGTAVAMGDRQADALGRFNWPAEDGHRRLGYQRLVRRGDAAVAGPVRTLIGLLPGWPSGRIGWKQSLSLASWRPSARLLSFRGSRRVSDLAYFGIDPTVSSQSASTEARIWRNGRRVAERQRHLASLTTRYSATATWCSRSSGLDEIRSRLPASDTVPSGDKSGWH
jgi:hypothetical protein